MPTYTLPAEITLNILGHIRPDPTSIGSTYSETLHTAPTRLSGIVIQYYSELEEFAQLRLVSNTWSVIVGRMVYEHLILVSYPFELLRRYICILRDGWIRQIRTITICNLTGWVVPLEYVMQSQVPINMWLKMIDLTNNVFGTCRLQKLEVLGHGSSAFRTRSWMSAWSPNLPTSLTKLSMAFCEYIKVSNALLGVGRGLEELELVGSVKSLHPIHPTFHLPKEFPNLKKLTLSGCLNPLQDYKKLFSRIGSLTYCPIQKQRIHLSNLRECRLIDSSFLSPQEVTGLLSINGIGKGLTVLHLHLLFPMWADPKNADDVAKECPALVDFQFDGPIQKSLYSVLSPCLKRLSLAVWPWGALRLSFLHLDEDEWDSARPPLDRYEEMCYFQPDKLLEAVDPDTTQYQLEELVVMIHIMDVDIDKETTLNRVYKVDIDQDIVDIMVTKGVTLKTQMLPGWPHPLEPPQPYAAS